MPMILLARNFSQQSKVPAEASRYTVAIASISTLISNGSRPA
jgi:hypothetical protein